MLPYQNTKIIIDMLKLRSVITLVLFTITI